MHCDIRYDLESPIADLIALQDMADWFDAEANERFGKIHELCQTAENRAIVRFACALSGVQGYPVTAFLDRYYPNLPEAE